ncbi:hypothetical protein FRC19_001273 [Serendipita sp. 401]|nr:hypothetical protein FRC19_001273 [Serendipita sp. 401]KAG8829098.1 hypothetical protein FRC18_009526 [Serendipita sp. 400]KAG9054519.1 hypothetical protein FS842_004914 [Serendipita sp. 407]
MSPRSASLRIPRGIAPGISAETLACAPVGTGGIRILETRSLIFPIYKHSRSTVKNLIQMTYPICIPDLQIFKLNSSANWSLGVMPGSGIMIPDGLSTNLLGYMHRA